MKIAYLITDLYSMGGAHSLTVAKMNHLASLGHQVFLITEYQAGKAFFYDLDERITHFDLDLDFEYLHSIANVFQRLREKRRLNRLYKASLSRVLNQIKADICISVFFTFRAEILPTIQDGSRKILELHSIKYSSIHPLEGESKSLSTRLLNKLFRKPKYEAIPKQYDKFVLLTQTNAQEWKGLNNVEIIPNFCTLESEEVAPLTDKRVLLLSRLSPEKNVLELLDIWALLDKKYQDWHLDIVGEGAEFEQIQEKIQVLGLEKQIHLKPATNNVAPHFLESSILVLTSKQESFGLVLVEAEVYGLPSVAYDCPCGPRGIIKDGHTGFLIPLHDKQMFAQKLELLMSDLDLRKTMGAKAKELSQSYTQAQVMEQWIDLFERLVEDK